MKRKLSILISVFMLSMAFVGCENKTGSAEEKDTNTTVKADGVIEEKMESETTDVSNREIAFEVVSNFDYNALAMNFSELVSASDLIVKIKVLDTKPFINDEGMIQTEISPEILEIYKGTYEGQKLYVNGGEMPYEEYSNNETIKKLVAGHENPNGDEDNSGKYVRQNVDNQYIFHSGDEYIFFASKRGDSGLFFSQYAYQGTFKISDGVVENAAITDEPLQDNISQIFSENSQLSNKAKAYNKNSGNSDLVIGEDEFESQIKKELKN